MIYYYFMRVQFGSNTFTSDSDSEVTRTQGQGIKYNTLHNSDIQILFQTQFDCVEKVYKI